MFSLSRYTLVGLWIGCALVLPMLTHAHVLPHAHADEDHGHPSPAPVPEHDHHHGHGHGHEHPAPVPERESHHHHALDDHFESDPVRLQKRAIDTDQHCEVVVATELPADEQPRSAMAVAPARGHRSRPPGATAARAPPALD